MHKRLVCVRRPHVEPGHRRPRAAAPVTPSSTRLFSPEVLASSTTPSSSLLLVSVPKRHDMLADLGVARSVSVLWLLSLETFDVAIVGGGPVGVGLAVELGQRGVSCVLVERH